MSETHVSNSFEPGARRRRDAGFTLPELLVSIIVLGSIVAVLSSAIIVTFRQRDNTEGRLNVSRAEQSLSMWLPADLASAGDVPSDDADASPCSVNLLDLTGCPANIVGLLTGSNALLLSWTDVVTTTGVAVSVKTNVSYHFKPAANGLFELVRIECQSSDGGAYTCGVNTVLRDLPGPPSGAFVPGVTDPWWVLLVSVPQPPVPIDPLAPVPAITATKNANRVVVTVNGGGDAGGLSGGINQISITAGGTTRSTIPPESPANAPTFTSTQSRCGGPITLVVDESNSVGGDVSHVRDAVTLFIETLQGTPVQIQVVRFHSWATILGDPDAWTEYYDMTDDGDVQDLLDAVPQLTGSWPSGSGGTNWEDAIFRAFYSPTDVTAAPNAITPKTVVFFTDGVPTWDRIERRGTSGVLTDLPAVVGAAEGWIPSTGGTYSQVAFNRANYWAAKWRAVEDTKLIGVGVGEDIDLSSNWMQSARRGYRQGWQERSTFTWQSNVLYESNWTYQQFVYLYEQNVTAWEQSGFYYEEADRWDEEYWDGNSWENTIKTTYHANNTTPDESDGWRRDNPRNGWDGMTQAQYNANNTTNDSSDDVRRVSTGSGWTPITQAVYNANNTTTNSSDGFRVTTAWTPITPAAYTAGNTIAGDTDGFRDSSSWAPITVDVYAAGNTTPDDDTDGFRRTSTGTWSSIPKAVYVANNTTPSDGNDGFRTSTGSWANISKAEYEANNTTSAESDGYRRFNPSGSWGQITEAQYTARNTTTNEDDGVRRGGKEYSPPFTDFEPAVTWPVPNAEILASFITGNPNGIEWSGVLNDNERDANMFLESDWTLVPLALKAVALGECGATLTLQTKLGGAAAGDTFTYERGTVLDSSGNVVSLLPKTVTTSLEITAATFDFDIDDGTYRIVDIKPDKDSAPTTYSTAGWACKAGGFDLVGSDVVPIPIADSPFGGIRVKVEANEAVSCVHTVITS